MSDTPAPPDPWKSFRGVMAGTLILEAIVVLLALPVVATADGGLTAVTGTYLIGLAVVLILLAGTAGPIVGDLGESRHPIGAHRGVGRVGGRRLHRPGLRRRLAADPVPAQRSEAP